MPFERPTREELLEQAVAEVEATLATGPLLPRSGLRALSYATAAQAHLLHGHLAHGARQLFADTADALELDRHASLYGITRTPAISATGPVVFEGLPGAVIPVGTQLQLGPGAVFVTGAEAIVGAGSTVIATVTAVTPGLAGNLAEGSKLTLSQPVLSVEGTVTVGTGGLVNGADPESDLHLRQRLLERLRNRPRGGSAADYVAWALEVPSVTRAWVLPGYGGPGGVGVTFVTDGAGSGLIPDGPKVAEVAAYLEQRRPVTAAVTVFPPTPVTINFVVGLAPLTAQVKAAVTEALRELVERSASPGQTLYVSRIHEAIATAPGEQDHLLSIPAANLTLGPSEIGVFGTVTFATVESLA